MEHDAIEHAVLEHVLLEHPLQLTEEEIVLSCNPWGEPMREDAIRLAIRELIGAGLLRREGASVLPTHAAVYQHRLESSA